MMIKNKRLAIKVSENELDKAHRVALKHKTTLSKFVRNFLTSEYNKLFNNYNQTK